MKAYKKDFGYSYAIGVFPTLELLNNKTDMVTGIVISQKSGDNAGVKKIKELARERHIPIDYSTTSIENLSKSENTYAVGVFKKYSEDLDKDKNHVVLVNPSDTGNLGTIIRTMIGFGFYDLAIIKPGVDIFDPKTIRASMGALFQMRFHYFERIDVYKDAFNCHPESSEGSYSTEGDSSASPQNDKRGYFPFMLSGEKQLSQVTFENPYSLIFGNEGAGLPENYRELGTSVAIEHEKTIDSLNLSMAVGIALYEARKT